MAPEPSWVWRLRADAENRWLVRLWYQFLRLCDSNTQTDRLVGIAALVLTAWYVVTSLRKGFPALMYAFASVAVVYAFKGVIAHLARLLLNERTLSGGFPSPSRFDRVVPQGAQKVALVGQNLAYRLDQSKGYNATVDGIRALLSRSGLQEIWLVLQTPRSLREVHPRAARHMLDISFPGLRALATDLATNPRVKVAFHPASTLSMLVVDWHRPSRLAVVEPKLQTLPVAERRLSVLMSGQDFDLVLPHFDDFLSEAERGEFPGASSAPLARLGALLDELSSNYGNEAGR